MCFRIRMVIFFRLEIFGVYTKKKLWHIQGFINLFSFSNYKIFICVFIFARNILYVIFKNFNVLHLKICVYCHMYINVFIFFQILWPELDWVFLFIDCVIFKESFKWVFPFLRPWIFKFWNVCWTLKGLT